MPPIGPSLYLKRVKQPTSLASPASGLPPLAPLSPDSKKESMKPLRQIPKKSPSLRDGNLNLVGMPNKLIPIKKHSPVSTQEWDNSIYAYNKKNTILLPSIDKMVIKLIKSYFNSYLAAVRGLNHSPELELSVYSKTYVSKPEIKHTNSKVIITIYRYMVNKNYILPKVEIDYKDIIPCRIAEIKSIAEEKK